MQVRRMTYILLLPCTALRRARLGASIWTSSACFTGGLRKLTFEKRETMALAVFHLDGVASHGCMRGEVAQRGRVTCLGLYLYDRTSVCSF